MMIEKAKQMGFCSGVRRAIDMVVKIAHERGEIETLGDVVHNRQVQQRLAELGVKVARDIDKIRGNTVVSSAHGISPQQEEEIRRRGINLIDTTCPFVHRAQLAARRLARAGFFVVVYGEVAHPEVKGILGWAGDKSLATMEARAVASLEPMPRRFGVLSQTTQMPAYFIDFSQRLIDLTFNQDSELHIIDTICRESRERQEEAIQLARKVDAILVVGGRHSANTNHLAQLCSKITATHLIETANEIQPSWLRGKKHIGVLSGTSTGDETIKEVVSRLEAMSHASG